MNRSVLRYDPLRIPLMLTVIFGLTALFRVWAAGSNSAIAARSPEPLIDINRATAQELESLPGLGPVLAEAIVKDRRSNGLYQTADDLLRVRGIGPARRDRLIPHIRFESRKIISVPAPLSAPPLQ